MKFFILTIAAIMSTLGAAAPVNVEGKCSLLQVILKQTDIYSAGSAVAARAPIDADQLYCKPDRLEVDGIQARQC
jgi:hypothetical protein